MAESPSTATPAAAASNPWVQGSTSIGVVLLGAGVILAALGGPNGYAADAEPALVRLVIAAALAVLGLGLLLSALTIVGVGWYSRHPHSDQRRT